MGPLLNELRSLGAEIVLQDGEVRIKAPRGAITAEMQSRLRAGRAAIIALLESTAVPARASLPPIPVHPPGEPAPLSHAQQRLWFLDQLNPGTAFLNLPGRLHIRGPLHVAALSAAIAQLAERHEVLRSAIVELSGLPHQIVKDVRVPLEVRDLSAMPD